MGTLSFQPVTSAWVILILAGVALIMLFVRPSFSKIGNGQRKTLNSIRSLVVLLALLALMRPGCVSTEEKLQSGVLLFLLDTSRSMQLPHLEDNSTRWQAITQAINANVPKFKELADKRIETRFFGFDNQLFPIEFGDTLKLPKTPDGAATDIGSNVFNSALETRGQRLVMMMVASDGVQTVLNPDIEISQAVTPFVNRETPVVSIPLGSPAATGQIADVSIKSFAEQHVVNVKNRLTASATIVTRGYVNQPVRVELVITDSDGKEEVVQPPVIVTPRRAVEETQIQITYKPTKPGEYRMKIRALPMPGELALRNNELEAFLTVNEQGLSVVMVGGLGWEQSYLRDALKSAEFIDLRSVEIYPSERPRRTAQGRINSEPRPILQELFEDESVDVFILSNIDSRLLYHERDNPNGLKALANLIQNRNKGLLMLGGDHSFGPGLYHSTPLSAILPIEMSKTEKQEFGEDPRRDLHYNEPLVMKVRGAGLPMTQLGADSVGWSQLPPLAGANRIRAKNNATVVLESDGDSPRPLLIAGVAGGRVLAFAGDTLYQWNTTYSKSLGRTYRQEYERFYRQMILWLANWDSRDDEAISIDFPQRRFAPKGRVRFGVKAQSVSGDFLDNVIYSATLIQPDGQSQLVAVPASGEGNWNEIDRELLAQPGVYVLEVDGKREGAPLGAVRRQFVVMDRDVEKSNPVANIERMAMLSNQTSEFGGQVIDPGQLGELLDKLIAEPPVEKVLIPSSHRFGESLPDSIGFLLAFVALLATEWVLRKKWGLV